MAETENKHGGMLVYTTKHVQGFVFLAITTISNHAVEYHRAGNGQKLP